MYGSGALIRKKNIRKLHHNEYESDVLDEPDEPDEPTEPTEPKEPTEPTD